MENFFRDIKTFFKTFAQLRSLLNRRQQRQAVGVLFLICFGAFFETLGVAAILPFISAIMSPALLWENDSVQLLSAIFKINDDIELIIFLGIAISGVYIFKNLF